MVPFSWKSVGVDVRGRSHTLSINYRTSHQIRHQADRLRPKSMTDVDDRRGTISVFNGPAPIIAIVDNPAEEAQLVAQWMSDRIAEGIQAEEIGVFVHSEA